MRERYRRIIDRLERSVSNHSQRLFGLECDGKEYLRAKREMAPCHECGVYVKLSKAHVVKVHRFIVSKWTPGPAKYYYCQWCAPDYTEIRYTIDGKKEVTSCTTEVIDCG